MSNIICQLRGEALWPKRYVISAINKHICDPSKAITILPIRTKYWHNRHRDDKYRRERAWKMWKIDLPDFDHMRKQDESKMTPDEIRSKLKEKGVAPPNIWNERELYQPCTMSVIEPYIPPETDGKSSSLLSSIKNPIIGGKKMIAARKSLNIIKSYEGEEFDLKEFAIKARDIYTKAHQLVAEENTKEVFDFVTEYCWPVMTAGLKGHTVIWRYLDDIEAPSVVQVRTGELMSKSNQYAQITVRFYSKQILAVYDRHGRLVLGSPTDVKEVLEYIVFEKYLVNEYGEWRIHERIRNLDESKRPGLIKTRVKI